MKKKSFIWSCAAAIAAGVLVSFMPADSNMTKNGETTIVNTTDLGKSVKGFKGTTPVKIHIRKDKIVKVEPLKNQETPQFFQRAKVVLAKYEGKTVKKATDLKVDAVSGATYSSKALIQNVQAGLKYFKNHQ